MIDSVAWAIGEPGAQHSVELARSQNYAATAGGNGVVAGSDLKVRPLGTPGPAVLVGPGACIVRNRATSGRSQSFSARVITDETVEITPTTSTGGRTDLIALVVRDTSIAGNGATPADPSVGPYVFIEVISGVSASVKRLQDVPSHQFVSGIALAKVTLPASTGTVIASMVTDLRELAQSHTETVTKMALSTGSGTPWVGGEIGPNPLQSTTWVTWPSVANWTVDVPSWATRATVIATVAGAKERVAGSWGELRVSFGSQKGAVVNYDFSYPGSPSASTHVMAGAFAIAASDRGKAIPVMIEGNRASGATGVMGAYSGTTSIVQIVFEAGVE